MDTRDNVITAALAPTHGMQPVLRSHDYPCGSTNDVVLGYEGGKMEVIDLRMLAGMLLHNLHESACYCVRRMVSCHKLALSGKLRCIKALMCSRVLLLMLLAQELGTYATASADAFPVHVSCYTMAIQHGAQCQTLLCSMHHTSPALITSAVVLVVVAVLPLECLGLVTALVV